MPYTGKEVKTEATVTVDGIDEYDTPMQETWFSGDWDAGVYSYKSPLMGERGNYAQKQASVTSKQTSISEICSIMFKFRK